MNASLSGVLKDDRSKDFSQSSKTALENAIKTNEAKAKL
jgi:hypothetical protein